MQTAWGGKDERTYEALHRATDQHGLELGGSGHGEARDGHDGSNREGEVHFRDAVYRDVEFRAMRPGPKLKPRTGRPVGRTAGGEAGDNASRSRHGVGGCNFVPASRRHESQFGGPRFSDGSPSGLRVRTGDLAAPPAFACPLVSISTRCNRQSWPVTIVPRNSSSLFLF
ncbi:hypothetical protein PCL_03390 [Purpureocillium lilacinum]|uniref:Uncharacterized protein n=1 Tax=Purpureocillium lilacinum TaxID=33203 RepID=A0A2U3ENW5_PURLI|nr:hypothetical protein Purlil1_4923 [Purpureocillium lilacinum]PWI76196.1 hypothetical protein PCL_03390 [Purpureocillium lilacinum]